MSKYGVFTNTAQQESKVFSALRGRCLYSLASGVATRNPQIRIQVIEEVDAALRDGKITDAEYRQLYSVLNREEDVSFHVSEEYSRLCELYRSVTESKVSLTSQQTKDFQDEIDLAYQTGGLSDEERDSLVTLLESDVTKTTPIPVVTARSVEDVPCRRRAQRKAQQHTEEYNRLVAEYKGLYSKSGDMESNINMFYSNVESAYARGEITLAEYKDCRCALDRTGPAMSQVSIDTDNADYASLKRQLVEAISSDDVVSDIVRQVAYWASSHGASEALVKSRPAEVASRYISRYLEAGGQLPISKLVLSESDRLQRMNFA